MKKIFAFLCSTLICMSFLIGLSACTNNNLNNADNGSGEQIIDLSVDECNLSDYLDVQVSVDCEPVTRRILVSGLYVYESTGVITVNISTYRNLDIKVEAVHSKCDLRISNGRLWKWEYTSGGIDLISEMQKVKTVNLSVAGIASYKENIKLSYTESMTTISSANGKIEPPSAYAYLSGTSGKIIIK